MIERRTQQEEELPLEAECGIASSVHRGIERVPNRIQGWRRGRGGLVVLSRRCPGTNERTNTDYALEKQQPTRYVTRSPGWSEQERRC